MATKAAPHLAHRIGVRLEYTLDPRWRMLFGNREFALIDWDKRLQIGKGQDMAKALQHLIAASADRLQRYALDWLKVKLQYGGRIRDFREALARSMRELERSSKGKEQLAVWLPIST